jgi:hypothetical protein
MFTLRYRVFTSRDREQVNPFDSGMPRTVNNVDT